jgi:uncharacterized protein
MCKYAAVICLVSIACPTLAQERQVHRVPMPDNVSLHTAVFLPPEIPAPVILLRSPYAKQLDSYAEQFATELVPLGFVVMVQDCRGTGRSEGEWSPYLHEVRDGVATVEWIRQQQAWCNGSIGTCGGSYLGYTQWAVASSGNGRLAAMYTEVPTFDWYETTYGGGAFRLGARVTWDTFVARPKVDQNDLIAGGLDKLADWDWKKSYHHLPLKTWDSQVGGGIPWWRASIDHPEDDDYWRQFRITDRLKHVSTPNITVAGWYDLFMDQALKYVPEVRRVAVTPEARRHQHLIIGPWGHEPNVPIGERDFGESASMDLAKIRREWYGHWLRGQNTGVETWPFLRLFVMGTNQWRDENEWPLARTKYINYYFSSSGKANSSAGDGRLVTTPPPNGHPDRFTYDPSHPVPTVGGEWTFFDDFGPLDQRDVEMRNDVLVYTSEPLSEPLEVTGPVKVVLYASTTAKDTDWTAKLVDVHPDGRAFNLCDGILRARYRDPNNPRLLEPNEIYRYTIDLWATSNVFLPGHRIRVQISSSNFPRFDRNPNTGEPFGSDTVLMPAEQTVHHDQRYPSHIVLPVIPQPQHPGD